MFKIDVMRELAEARKVSVAQIALAWLLHQPAVASVIIGAKRVDQLGDNLAATALPVPCTILTLPTYIQSYLVVGICARTDM